MKIKPEVILGQQLAARADGFLKIIDESLKPVPGDWMIMREQAAAGVCQALAHLSQLSRIEVGRTSEQGRTNWKLV